MKKTPLLTPYQKTLKLKSEGRECSHSTCGSVCRREKVVKKKVGVRRVSKKREELNKEYAPKAKAYREANKYCAVHSPDCTIYTQGVHHMKGKQTSELLLDEKWWMPSCNRCNNYIENHDAWAREQGFKLSKF